MNRQSPRQSPDSTRKGVPARGKVEEIDAAVVRFAGDASDGMQLVGAQFMQASAIHGNSTYTLVDPSAEIRAPAGTLPGVWSFTIRFSKMPSLTAGDALDVLVATNPAALRANLADLEAGGILIVNADSFTPDELAMAGYASDPLNDGSLKDYRVLAVPMNQLSREAVARLNLIPREVSRCRNFFPLGLVFWLFDRPIEPTLKWIRDTYAKNPAMIEAGTRSLKAGYLYGETTAPLGRYRIGKGEIAAGRYRHVGGLESIGLGLITAAHQTKLPMVFASAPVAPSADLLHQMVAMKQPGVKVVQAEDDIGALNLAIGAAFGGALAVTATSGPGLSLQSEALGLAVMSELPCVVIDVQRAGPSTGMPSKTEQADLLQALCGRHGECPLVVLAQATPSDGFDVILEAIQLAVRAMTPVIVLSDVYLAQSAAPWRVPALPNLDAIAERVQRAKLAFRPYQRDEHSVRPWAVPGMARLEHRTGGLEKDIDTGVVSYDLLNHERMVKLRAEKIARLADEIPPLTVFGPDRGDLLVLGWGSTYGAIRMAVERCQSLGRKVAAAHLRHLHPMPRNLASVLKSYRKVLVPELNTGQLASVLRSSYGVAVESLSKVQGMPFTAKEIAEKIESMR